MASSSKEEDSYSTLAIREDFTETTDIPQAPQLLSPLPVIDGPSTHSLGT